METNKIPIDEAWQIWREGLEGKDINSVFNQVISMVWDTVILKVIREGQKIQFEVNPGAPKINQSLYSFIYRNYLHTQTASIRRLIDTSSGLTGEKGVYSLNAIIKDIEKYKCELTRQKYFELNQIPYDVLTIKEQRKTYFRNHSSDEKVFNIPPEIDWVSVEERHKIFDRLSDTPSKGRNPQDIIVDEVFYCLKEKLDECQPILYFVNKFVAHLATPESRSSFNKIEYQISLRDIWNAHKIIYQVANFLSGIFFSVDHMALPIENPSFFDYWNEPIFPIEGFDEIQGILSEYEEETEGWRNSSNRYIWHAIEGEISKHK